MNEKTEITNEDIYAALVVILDVLIKISGKNIGSAEDATIDAKYAHSKDAIVRMIERMKRQLYFTHEDTAD